MAIGTALCPHCAGERDRVMNGEHVVSGELITDHNWLLRHRDESQDVQFDRNTGKHPTALDAGERAEAVIMTRPAMRTVEIDGLQVKLPAGFRPCFSHDCPVLQAPVTLYADTEGGGVTDDAAGQVASTQAAGPDVADPEGRQAA